MEIRFLIAQTCPFGNPSPLRSFFSQSTAEALKGALKDPRRWFTGFACKTVKPSYIGHLTDDQKNLYNYIAFKHAVRKHEFPNSFLMFFDLSEARTSNDLPNVSPSVDRTVMPMMASVGVCPCHLPRLGTQEEGTVYIVSGKQKTN